MSAQLDPNGRKRFGQIGSMILVIGLTLFLAAGRWNWWNAWAYLGLYLG